MVKAQCHQLVIASRLCDQNAAVCRTQWANQHCIVATLQLRTLTSIPKPAFPHRFRVDFVFEFWPVLSRSGLLALCVHAIPDTKPASIFAGIALERDFIIHRTGAATSGATAEAATRTAPEAAATSGTAT